MSKSKPDLQSLAHQAHEEIRRTTERAQLASGIKKSGSGWRTAAAWIILVAIVVFGEMHVTELEAALRSVLPAHAAQRKQLELEGILAQARDSIEVARAADGSLPEALPHAALAAVVRYERGESGYRLIASSGELTVALDADGNREVLLGEK